MPNRDREEFRRNAGEFRSKGEAELLSTGAFVDGELVQELARRGSDLRHGVNLVCFPTKEIVEQIAAVQRELSEFEPGQYYYAPQDLHLTLVEVCHSRSEEEATQIARAIRSLAPALLERQQAAAVDEAMIASDARGAAVNFLACDERLQRLRTTILEELGRGGVAAASRYPPRSAHVTFLRYVMPLRTPAARWVELLRRCRIEAGAPWVLNPVWLTWGATWYGMESRISRFGPMTVGTSAL